MIMKNKFLLLLISVTLIWVSVMSERRITLEKLQQQPKPVTNAYTSYDLSQAIQNAGRLILRGVVIKE